jgi:hypothetical protein
MASIQDAPLACEILVTILYRPGTNVTAATCPNCLTSNPTNLVPREFRYRNHALAWHWTACENCADEDWPRIQRPGSFSSSLQPRWQGMH